MNPIIEARELTKEYSTPQGPIRAVDQIELDVAEGEFFCLLGPNGAGKTTTIKMLTTLTKPTTGRASVGGYDVGTNATQVRRNIGYSSQEIIADELLTGRENLALVARLQGIAHSELPERVEAMLIKMELSQCADRLVKSYSGGMRRKLDLAGALIHRPPLLFLDEPTLGLDPVARQAVWSLLRELNRQQEITIFMTTHYLGEADVLSDRVAIMDRGRVKALDAPEALKRRVGGESLEDVFIRLTGRTPLEGTVADSGPSGAQ